MSRQGKQPSTSGMDTITKVLADGFSSIAKDISAVDACVKEHFNSKDLDSALASEAKLLSTASTPLGISRATQLLEDHYFQRDREHEARVDAEQERKRLVEAPANVKSHTSTLSRSDSGSALFDGTGRANDATQENDAPPVASTENSFT